jgi:hypothetical protein
MHEKIYLDGYDVTDYMPQNQSKIKWKKCIEKISNDKKIKLDRVHTALQTKIPYNKPHFISTNDKCTSDTKSSMITLDEYTGNIVGIKKKINNQDFTICFSCEDLKIMRNHPTLEFSHLPLTHVDYNLLHEFYDKRCN